MRLVRFYSRLGHRIVSKNRFCNRCGKQGRWNRSHWSNITSYVCNHLNTKVVRLHILFAKERRGFVRPINTVHQHICHLRIRRKDRFVFSWILKETHQVKGFIFLFRCDIIHTIQLGINRFFVFFGQKIRRAYFLDSHIIQDLYRPLTDTSCSCHHNFHFWKGQCFIIGNRCGIIVVLVHLL